MAETGPLDAERLRQLRDSLRLSPAELAQRVAAHLFTENILKVVPPGGGGGSGRR